MNKPTVSPKDFSGFNFSIAQLWGSGPNWTITCGECEATFKKRIPMINHPGLVCPSCGAINKLPIVITKPD